jgi:hypothetical protein
MRHRLWLVADEVVSAARDELDHPYALPSVGPGHSARRPAGPEWPRSWPGAELELIKKERFRVNDDDVVISNDEGGVVLHVECHQDLGSAGDCRRNVAILRAIDMAR